MRILLAAALLLSSTDGGSVEDFESPTLDGWEKVSSPAHPPYNTIDPVRDAAAKSGRQFLRMVTQGGSTSLARSPRLAWPVEAGRPYRLSAFARLSGTKRNSASIALVWVGADGARLGELRSTAVSQPGDWTELVLDVPHAPAGAAGAAPRLDFDGDDVRGEAHFDRIALAVVERLDLLPSGRAHAVFAPQEHPRFTLAIDGVPPGIHGITLKMGEIHRSVKITTPAESSVEGDLPPAPPGAHTVTASIDGRAASRNLVILVPNPWISSRADAPPLIAEADPDLIASPDVLALAGLSGIVRADPVPAEPLETSLRRRLLDPSAPLRLDRRHIDAEGHPQAAILALRAVNDFLTGAASIGDPALFPPAVRVAAFRRGATVAMAVWSESGDLDLPVALNEGARLYPPLGALRPLRFGEILHLTAMPLLILGIDPVLLELKLQLSGADLPLQVGPSTRTLTLHNPSRTRPLRDVRVRLEDLPPGWRVSPRAWSAATLAPDADLAEDLQFLLPAAETERVQTLRFEVAFLQDGREQTVHVSRVVRLASPIVIESAVSAGPVEGSRKVSIRILNASDRTMTLAVRARLPNLPEQMEILRSLAPGATSAPVEYVVKDAALVDPTRLEAEIVVQESVGARAGARKVVSLK